MPALAPSRPPSVCQDCGVPIKPDQSCCWSCAATGNTAEPARRGRVAAQSRVAQARRAETQRGHAAAKRAWQAFSQPTWPNEETYLRKIRPHLAKVRISVLSSALGVSEPYAADIRAGRRRPHPRHWPTLARLVGAAPDE